RPDEGGQDRRRRDPLQANAVARRAEHAGARAPRRGVHGPAAAPGGSSPFRESGGDPAQADAEPPEPRRRLDRGRAVRQGGVVAEADHPGEPAVSPRAVQPRARLRGEGPTRRGPRRLRGRSGQPSAALQGALQSRQAPVGARRPARIDERDARGHADRPQAARGLSVPGARAAPGARRPRRGAEARREGPRPRDEARPQGTGLDADGRRLQSPAAAGPDERSAPKGGELRPRCQKHLEVTMRALVLGLLAFATVTAQAQSPKEAASAEELRGGKGFLPTRAYSEAEDQKLLASFDGLRVADVTDG